MLQAEANCVATTAYERERSLASACSSLPERRLCKADLAEPFSVCVQGAGNTHQTLEDTVRQYAGGNLGSWLLYLFQQALTYSGPFGGCEANLVSDSW